MAPEPMTQDDMPSGRDRQRPLQQLQLLPVDVARLHRVFVSLGVVGGAGGADKGEDGGVAGSLTPRSMRAIFAAMREHAGWQGGRSGFFDFGAESGRTLLHAVLSEGAVTAVGCEVNRLHCLAAQDAHIPGVLRRLGVPFRSSSSQEERGQAASLPSGGHTTPTAAEGVRRRRVLDLPRRRVSYELPAGDDGGERRGGGSIVYDCHDGAELAAGGMGPGVTHAYSFWQGMPESARRAFGRLFAATAEARCVVVVQHALRGQQRASPERHMWELGFGRLRLAAQLPVCQSNAQYRAYVFVRGV